MNQNLQKHQNEYSVVYKNEEKFCGKFDATENICRKEKRRQIFT